MKGIYLYPHLGGIDLNIFRIAGPGLGNSLLPWARCIVASKKYKLPIIDPPWFNFKPGAWIRNEIDKRTYSGLFKKTGTMSEINRIYALCCFRRLSEELLIDYYNKDLDNHIIEFRGLKNFFQPILNDYQLVKNELLKIVNNTIDIDRKDLAIEKCIVVHIRLGDFARSTVEGPKPGQDNHRLPIFWYKAKIEQLLQLLPQCKVLVFSDGADSELSEILSIENCFRIKSVNAISDLLLMTKAGVLIASGSTFSMWASYLGRMPVIWFPGQIKQRLYPETTIREIESAEDETFNTSFCDEVISKVLQ